jgi:Protein of unknown function (DUF1566)
MRASPRIASAFRAGGVLVVLLLGACAGGHSAVDARGAGGGGAGHGGAAGLSAAGGAAPDGSTADVPATVDGAAAAETAGAADAARDGATAETDAPLQPPVDVVARGAGCGKALPADQPKTLPGTPTGYKQYRVMQTGRTLGLPDPLKAIERTFWVRVPADYDPARAYRVVYLGQSCGPSGMANLKTLPLYAAASGGTEQAIYVAIDPPDKSAAVNCYDQTGALSEEWEAFELFHGVVDATYCVDNNRVFVAGDASGGGLANMWGCYFAGAPSPARRFAPGYHIRGQASIASGEPAGNPACSAPVAALWFDSYGAGLSRDRVLRQNGCFGSPTVPWTAMPTLCRQFIDCPKDYPVIFCTPPGTGDQPKTSVPAFTAFFDMVSSGKAPTAALPGFEPLCLEGQTTTCASAHGARGACAKGTATCRDTQWGACSILPAAVDTCAPANDDSCDGVAYTGCACRWMLPAVGAAAPARFDTSVADVVTDTATGLVWAKSASPPAQLVPEACAGTIAGFSDWHVPSVHELTSIVDFAKKSPAIDGTAFPGTAAGLYWSTTQVSSGGQGLWYVDFDLGGPYETIDVLPPARTRCVRTPATGQPACFPAAGRFVVGNGVVQDKTTGLTWRSDFTAKLGWQEALAACAALGGGFRAPSAQELLGIVDYKGNVPTIDFAVFAPDAFPDRRLWTSTPLAGTPGMAWTVSFDNGIANPIETNAFPYPTRCVR